MVVGALWDPFLDFAGGLAGPAGPVGPVDWLGAAGKRRASLKLQWPW